MDEKLRKILDQVKKEVSAKLDGLNRNDFTLKADNSLLTEMDLFISDLFKSKISKAYPELNFYSEEDKETFCFPMVILDPIDGTKEFVKGSDECVISFGIYYSAELSDKRNFSWIYNFNNNLEFSSDDLIGKKSEKDIGFVSSTEFEEGLYDNSKSEVISVGSIAYKLALLSHGKCRFVVTKKPKHIWDIMAGTHICYKNNIFLYQNGERKDSLNNILFSPTLIWSCEEFKNEISV